VRSWLVPSINENPCFICFYKTVHRYIGEDNRD